MQLKAMKSTKTFKDLVMNTYIFLYLHSNSGSGGRVARLSSAKAATAVRIRSGPPKPTVVYAVGFSIRIIL